MGAFCISSTSSIEAIAGLIPIHLHIQKLNGRFHLRAHSLPANHIITSMIEARPMNHINSHCFSLKWLMPKQHSNIKGPIIDIDNRFNEVLSLFSPFNCEFSLGNRLIDFFPKYFLFHSLNRNCESSVKSYLHKLEDITLQALSDPLTVVVVSDASIKNYVTTSIAHIHVHSSPVIKTIYHAVNIMSTKAELFAIRCGINQATYLLNIKRIVIISDSIHVAKRIFDSLVHLYQIYLAAISCELREFFIRSSNNSIEFWDYPSYYNWGLHLIIDKETKKFNLIPILPCKSS